MKLKSCCTPAKPEKVQLSISLDDIWDDIEMCSQINQISSEFFEMYRSYETYCSILDCIKESGGVTKSLEILFGENFTGTSSMEAEAEEQTKEAEPGMWEKIKAFFAKIWEWVKNLFTSNEKIAGQIDELIKKLNSGDIKPKFPVTTKRPKYLQEQLDAAVKDSKPAEGEKPAEEAKEPVKEAEDFTMNNVQDAVKELQFVKDALIKMKTIGDGVKAMEDEYKSKEGKDPGFFSKASMYMKSWGTKQFVMSATRAYAGRLLKMFGTSVEPAQPAPGTPQAEAKQAQTESKPAENAQQPAENKAEEAKPEEGKKQEEPKPAEAAKEEPAKQAEQKQEAQPKAEDKQKAENKPNSKEDYIKMCGESANDLAETCKKRLTKLDAIMKASHVDDTTKLNPSKAQSVMSDEDFQFKNITLKRLVTLRDIKFNISKIEKTATHDLDVMTGDTSKMTENAVKAIYADVLAYHSYVSALFKLATSTANSNGPKNKVDVNSTQTETTEDGAMSPEEAKKIAANKEKPVNPGDTQTETTEDGSMDPNEVKAATVKAEDILKNRIGNLSGTNTQIGDNLKVLNEATSATHWPDDTPLKQTKTLKVPTVLTGGKRDVTFEPKTIGDLKSKLKEVSERISSFTANAEKSFKQNTVNQEKGTVLTEVKKDSEELSTFARELISLAKTCAANCKSNPNKQGIGSKIKEGAQKIVQKVASPFTSTKAKATALGEYSFEGFSLEELVEYNKQLTKLIITDTYDADIVSYADVFGCYSKESLSDKEFWQ